MQTCASYVVATLKGGPSLSQGVISPVCTDMPAACLSSGCRPPNIGIWTKRKTHLDRVGSASTLTWGCRAQHSSTGCKVAGAVWRPVKQQWSGDKRGLLRLVQTSGSNLLPALCHSLWELKIVRHESDVISVFPTTRAEGIMLLVRRLRAMTTTRTEGKKRKPAFSASVFKRLKIVSNVTTP